MAKRKIPLPGRAVRGSTSGRPVMAALDLLGRRWALRVLWELARDPRGFRALQADCGDVSSSVLRERLLELVDAKVVAQDADGSYRLTPLGDELGTALAPLDGWARRWATALARR
ncbi:MAG: helix-turn-helix transcriptional regulator [Deltaproteobacteria bacterium]|nr:helix-turn-helix transcriptional regulator [Deltaproteobacteria bacterium]